MGSALRLGHRDRDRAAHFEHRDRQQLLGFFGRDDLQQGGIDQAMAKLASLHAERAGEHVNERRAADDALLDEQLAEHAAAGLLLGQRLGELLLRNRALAQQRLADSRALAAQIHRKLLTAVFASSK